MHACCDRRETEGDRQEQRHDEEDPGLHEQQEEERTRASMDTVARNSLCSKKG